MPVDWTTISMLRPEVVLLAAASAILIAGAFKRSRAWWGIAAVASYVLAGMTLAAQMPHAGTIQPPPPGMGVVIPISLIVRFLLVLAVAAGIAIVCCRLSNPGKKFDQWDLVLVLAIAAVGVPFVLRWSPSADFSIPSRPVLIDPLSMLVRWLALLVGLVFTLTAARRADEDLASESIGCLMLVTTGIMLAAVANELVVLFLGLELISIPTYVLLFLGRRDRASGEATMKYFFLSILSSALLLYGFSLLYGIGGTTLISGTAEFPGIREALTSPQVFSANALSPLAPLALVLILAGLGFKLTVAPLQFYAPDVYQGTTNANAGLLAVAPKIAGIAALIRLVIVAMPLVAGFAWELALVLAVVTMTVGNVCALWQRNVRRLMAYSSIAHGGYLLIGLAAAAATHSQGGPGSSEYGGGVAAMLLHVAAYALATMGLFTALSYLSGRTREISAVEELAGLGRTHPLAAGAMAIFLFSLAGLPPLAGFWGKLSLFASAVRLALQPELTRMSFWFAILAGAGALNAAIAAAYYLRIVATMYFQNSPQQVSVRDESAGGAATYGLSLLVLAIGVMPGRLVESTLRSEAQLSKSQQAAQSVIPAATVAQRSAP